MLKKIVYSLLRHRHFWREVGFDELSELYVSMMFRGLSISLPGILPFGRLQPTLQRPIRLPKSGLNTPC